MFGSKKKKEEAMMNEVRHHASLRKAYINEIKRKDGKYNFIFLPFFNLGSNRYHSLSVYSISGVIIKSLMINGQVVTVNLKDQLQLSLKPGSYTLDVNLQIEYNLLRNVLEDADKKDPTVRHFAYKDLYRCDNDLKCEIRVNNEDIAYVYLKAEVHAKYHNSKNLYFMDSYRHSYEMRQTSLAHIESMFPTIWINNDCRYKYTEIDQCYIDEVHKLYKEELRVYKVNEVEAIEKENSINVKPTPVVETKTVKKDVIETKTITYNNGNRYEGQCKNGIPDGIGTYYYKTGEHLVGTFENGKANGTCTIYYNDKSFMICKYKDNLKHGSATLFKPDGTTKDYQYDNGKLIEETKAKPTSTPTSKPIVSSTTKTTTVSSSSITPTTSTTNVTNSTIPSLNNELKNIGGYYGQVKNNIKDGFGFYFLTANSVMMEIYKNGINDGPVIEYSGDNILISLKLNNLKNKFSIEFTPNRVRFMDNYPTSTLNKSIWEATSRKSLKPTKDKIIRIKPDFNYVGTGLTLYSTGVGIRYNYLSKTYFGEFSKGKLNGFGLIYDDNTVLMGEFDDGLLNGFGMQVSNYKSTSYTMKYGKWSNGKFIG